MGVNQSYEGVRTAQAIINLALMTGNIGRPGTGANSITGQCNAMGSRLFSNTTNLLGGHDFHERRASRRRSPTSSTSTAERIPDADQLGLRPDHRRHPARARSRACGSIATNPAHSWINQDMLRDVLDRLDFLVVQDMYTTHRDGASWPTWSCRPPAGARRKARSSIPSGASA